MKKQYFIYSVIICMLVIFNVKAQNTPIDDFLKKYPLKENMNNISISQPMLQSIFARPKHPVENPNAHHLWMTYKELNIPEAYGSISVSKTDNISNMFVDFKKILLSSNYENLMEMNKENSDVLAYYMKKVNNNTSEIVVLRQQKDQFSAIYIKADIELRQVDDYLRFIKLSLVRLGYNNIFLYQSSSQFARTMFDDFKSSNPHKLVFEFDSFSSIFKWNNETNRAKERAESDAINHSLRFPYIRLAKEGLQQQLEEETKQTEEEQITK